LKNIQMPDFMKILPVTAELRHADRKTDMTTLAVAFRNFAKALKNETRSKDIIRNHM
jgi:hypothetical protein